VVYSYILIQLRCEIECERLPAASECCDLTLLLCAPSGDPSPHHTEEKRRGVEEEEDSPGSPPFPFPEGGETEEDSLKSQTEDVEQIARRGP
jgi:hypothetical protein